MSDYRLRISVRNNRILTLIEQTHDSMMSFARDRQIPYQGLVNLVALRAPARNANGEWAKIVVTVATALRVEPEELFSERQLAGLPVSTVIRNVSEDDILSLTSPEAEHLSISQDQDDRIFARQIVNHLEKLPSKHRFIIEKYFGLNDNTQANFTTIAEEMNLSVTRVSQLYQNGIRKLKGFPAIRQLMKPGCGD